MAGARRPVQSANGLGAFAGDSPLALRLLTLFRDPVRDGPTNLRGDWRGRPLLDPTQRGELLRLKENLESRFW